MIPTHGRKRGTDAGHQSIELRGGPYDGQHMLVPGDEDSLRLFHHGDPVFYHRAGRRDVFICQRELGRLLGGKRGQT